MTRDPLSVPDIAMRQVEVEQQIQQIPQMQLESDTEALDAESEYGKAKARAGAEVKAAARAAGEKLTVAEREEQIDSRVGEQWYRMRDTRIQADYVRTLMRVALAELTSLQSRLKAANAAGVAHSQFGGG